MAGHDDGSRTVQVEIGDASGINLTGEVGHRVELTIDGGVKKDVTEFFVYNTGEKKVIFQDNLANGDIKWKNNYQFIVTTIPEIVKGDDEENIQNFGYTYDVIKRRKLSDQVQDK